jgi:hypothetical protein
VQVLSGDDPLQHDDVTSTPLPPTLEHDPTLPPAPTPLDNSTADSIHKLLIKDQQCITAVNTSESSSPTQGHISISLPAPANELLADDVRESLTDNRRCISVTNTSSSSTQEHVPTSRSSRSRILTPPENLRLVLPISRSCWIKDKNKLDSNINHLEELASSASAEHRSQLLKQVATLRTMSKKQDEHLIELLQLSEECANRCLLYISAEIEQQSSFLDQLDGRLKTAEDLRRQAADLKTLYESKTVAIMQGLRTTGKTTYCHLQKQNIETLIFSTFGRFTRTKPCSVGWIRC